MIDNYSFSTELMIQIVCFYIGVGLFLFICTIPPIILILPYALPLTLLICIIVNISFVIRYIRSTTDILTVSTTDNTTGNPSV